jgi:hypothetical protein
MLLTILKNVDDAVSDLQWGAKRTCMVAIGKDAARAVKQSIHRSRHPDAEPRSASGKRPLVVRLDEEMDVIRLNREMHEPEPIS